MKPANPRELDGKTHIEIGKTFSTRQRFKPGDVILVEAETVNRVEDKDKDSFDVSFWVPNMIGPVDGKPDSLEAILARAEQHGILQAKTVEDGETVYLPTKPGSPKTAFKAFAEFLKATIDDYPDENLRLEFSAHNHFRGRSAHGDPRFEFRREKKHHLIGFTLAWQTPGAIKEPVTTLEQAKKLAQDASLWKIDFKTGEIKKRRIRSGVVRKGDLRAFPKAKEIPADWLNVEGVTEKTDPGERPPAGATRQYPGVFHIIERGEVEWGAQKPWMREFFLNGKKWKGRWVFRLIKREGKAVEEEDFPIETESWEQFCIKAHEGDSGALADVLGIEEIEAKALLDEAAIKAKADEVLPLGVEEERARGASYWVLMQPDDQTPYVLSKEAMEKDWLPPKEVSCLPKAIFWKVPKDLRYWEMDRKEALEARRELAGMEELGGPGKLEKKSALKKLPSLRGLLLVEPHGKLIHQKKKRAIVKKRRLEIAGERMLLISGGKAWGEITLGEPEEIDLDLFVARARKHRIRKEEREEWWPGAKEFWYWPISKFKKYKPPVPVETPQGPQTIIREENIREIKASETAEFHLERHWWRGQIVIRFGPSTEHYDLRLKEDGKLWHLVLQENPLEEEEVAAYLKPMRDGGVTDTEGRKVELFQLKPGQRVRLKPNTDANPTKDTPAWIEALDAGPAEILEEGKGYRKIAFRGKKLKGAWVCRAEDPDDPGGFWSVARSGGPETKGTEEIQEVRNMEDIEELLDFEEELDDDELKELGQAVKAAADLKQLLNRALEAIDKENAKRAVAALNEALEGIKSSGYAYGYAYGYPGRRKKKYDYDYDYGYPAPRKADTKKVQKLIRRAITALELDEPDFEKAKKVLGQAMKSLGYGYGEAEGEGEAKAAPKPDDLKKAIMGAVGELNRTDPDLKKVAAILKKALDQIGGYSYPAKPEGKADLEGMEELAVKALREEDGGLVVGGYLLLWGDPQRKDLAGDFFTPETYLGLDVYKSVPVWFHHGLDETVGLESMGRRIKAAPDDMGVWVEEWIDKSKKYWAAVEKLLKAGKLFFSPGSAPHLVKRADDGKLLSFPIIDDTLTPIPAQFRLKSVEEIQAAYKAAGLDLPEGLDEGEKEDETKLSDLDVALELKKFELELKEAREA